MARIQHWVYLYYNTFLFMIVVFVLSYGINSYLGYRANGYIFLLAVLLVSSFASFGPIFCAAFLSALVWNFFFIPPTFTFNVSSPEDMMMILAYFITAIVAGVLNIRIRKQEKIFIQREYKANILYELVSDFSDAKDQYTIMTVAIESIQRLFN